jgi:hypothetical protein
MKLHTVATTLVLFFAAATLASSQAWVRWSTNRKLAPDLAIPCC